MDKATIDQVAHYVDKLAQKLGIGVEHIWPWFIREQYVDAIVVVIPTLAFIFYAWYALRAYGRVSLNYKAEIITRDARDFFEPFWAITGIIALVVGVIASLFAIGEVGDLLNINYSAMSDMINMFSNIK